MYFTLFRLQTPNKLRMWLRTSIFSTLLYILMKLNSFKADKYLSIGFDPHLWIADNSTTHIVARSHIF